MATIASEKVTVNAAPEEVFAFVSDMRNFHELLPQDKISHWEAEEGWCKFKVQNTYKIGLVKDGAEAPSVLHLKSSDDSPFPFTLDVHLEAQGGETLGYQICEAKLNPFLKMMVEKPLKNLFDYIAQKLQEKYA